jgi:hypothetical protein
MEMEYYSILNEWVEKVIVVGNHQTYLIKFYNRGKTS